MSRENIKIYIDGAAKGNPGEAGIGIVLLDAHGKSLFKIGCYIGHATNNQAEYQALIMALEKVLDLGRREIIVFTDSELIEKQIKGLYKVKNETLKQYHTRARDLLNRFQSFRMVLIPREKNREADRLASKAAQERADQFDEVHDRK